MSTRAGETFVWGRQRETAQALLAAAERLGEDPWVVRTTDSGFVVPDAVADEAAADLQSDLTKPSPIPDQQPPAEF